MDRERRPRGSYSSQRTADVGSERDYMCAFGTNSSQFERPISDLDAMLRSVARTAGRLLCSIGEGMTNLASFSKDAQALKLEIYSPRACWLRTAELIRPAAQQLR